MLASCYWFFLDPLVESPKRITLLVIVAASFYGITDEFHQSFVPERTMSSIDWAVDTFAAIFVASVFSKLKSN